MKIIIEVNERMSQQTMTEYANAIGIDEQFLDSVKFEKSSWEKKK